MLNQHYKEVKSTQEMLKKLVKDHPNEDQILISTTKQTGGRGRGENIWKFQPGSLAFSFTLLPSPVLSLSAIEVSVLIASFFKELNIELKLKWPNDLFYHDKKCGGILIESIDGKLFCGVGINIAPTKDDDTYISIEDKSFEKNYQKKLPEKFYKFFLEKRMDTNEILLKWNDLCVHKNKNVTIKNKNQEISGKFIKLGDDGEAIIKVNNSNHQIYSGSLFIEQGELH